MKGKVKFSEMSEKEIASCVEKERFEEITFDGSCELPEISGLTTFSCCDFVRMSIFHFDFICAKFDDCNFENCDFHSCDFCSCEFVDCWLEWCDFGGCNFADAMFQRAHFRNNSWWQANLNQALIGYNSAGAAECELFAALAALEAARAKTVIAYDAAKERVGR